LRELRRGVISLDTGHPEIPNAVRFIDICRKSLDDRIYEFFDPKPNYHAINGCAGMGKSVLLAYSIYVFASNYKVVHKDGNRELINFEDKSRNIGLPTHRDRRIYVYAVKKKQIDTLKAYWEKIKKQISLINPDSRPHLQNPVFKQWQGEITKDCNVLVIDESHDLSYEHQQVVAKWINQRNNTSKYLLVTCDRNQALKRQDSDESIIAGVNFSRHSTRLNRIYRCPFPVYVASIGLMFRWFVSEGAKILLSTQRLREYFGFLPRIKEDDDSISLTMRNDCHPGNNWNQTVSFFKSCSMALRHLAQFFFEKKDVLWVSFQKLDSDFDYTEIQGKFTYVDLRNDADDEIDKYIKGQEFGIVIIEGLPSDMNPQDLPNIEESWGDKTSKSECEMWKSRRNIYVVCSRASAFLYFIADIDRASSDANIQELKNLIEQVSLPLRGKNESGQTWTFRITKSNITRKPPVFRDIDDIEKEESEPINKQTRVIEFAGPLTVPALASAFGISPEKLQKRLPENAKAKYNISITVKLSHAEQVASQLGIILKRITEGSDEKDINNKKIVDIDTISKLPEALEKKASEKTVNKQSHKSAISSHETRTNKITQDELIDYVVKVLYEYGGHATKNDVEEKIYRMLKGIFKQTWYQETVANNIPRWKHNIAWAKDRARQHHGLVKSAKESGRGIWELTESGKRYYQKENLSKL